MRMSRNRNGGFRKRRRSQESTGRSNLSEEDDESGDRELSRGQSTARFLSNKPASFESTIEEGWEEAKFESVLSPPSETCTNQEEESDAQSSLTRKDSLKVVPDESAFRKHSRSYRQALIQESNEWFREVGLRQSLLQQQRYDPTTAPPPVLRWCKPDTGRPEWPHRNTFIVVAVVAAVGVSNFYSFFDLYLKYSGGAFIIPYAIMSLVSGTTFLILEFALGQGLQGSAVVVYDALGHRARGIGVACIYFTIVNFTYYNVLVSFNLGYLVQSFSDPLPWLLTDEDVYKCNAIESMVTCNLMTEPCDWKYGKCKSDEISKALLFFDQKILNVGDTVNWNSALRSFFSTIVIFFALHRKFSHRTFLIYFSAISPTIFLFILAINTVGIPGDSFDSFYSSSDIVSILKDPELWFSIFSHGLFNLSLFFGTMITLASYNPRKQNVVVDAVVVIIADLTICILCSVTSYIILNHYSHINLKDIMLKATTVGSIPLFLCLYSLGLSLLPGSQVFCALFFVSFYLLGINSSFSMFEACVSCITDSRSMERFRRRNVVGICCVISFCVSLLYSQQDMLLLIAHDRNNSNGFGLFSIAVCVSLYVGWIKGANVQARYIGTLAVGMLGLTAIVSTILMTLYYIAFPFNWPIYVNAYIVLPFIVVVGVIVSFFLCTRQNTRGAKERLWWLFLGNIELFRAQINMSISPDDHWHKPIPMIWGIVVKFAMAPILTFLLIFSILKSPVYSIKSRDTLSIVSWSLVAQIPCIILIGIVYPKVFEFLAPTTRRTFPLVDREKMRSTTTFTITSYLKMCLSEYLPPSVLNYDKW